MNEILKVLQRYQLTAVKKGMSFDIDITNNKGVVTTKVTINYNGYGVARSAAMMDVRFNNEKKDFVLLEKFNRIRSFIDSCPQQIN